MTVYILSTARCLRLLSIDPDLDIGISCYNRGGPSHEGGVQGGGPHGARQLQIKNYLSDKYRGLCIRSAWAMRIECTSPYIYPTNSFRSVVAVRRVGPLLELPLSN